MADFHLQYPIVRYELKFFSLFTQLIRLQIFHKSLGCKTDTKSYDFIGRPRGVIESAVEHRKVRFQLFKIVPLVPNDDRSRAKSAKLQWALEITSPARGLCGGETNQIWLDFLNTNHIALCYDMIFPSEY